MSEILKNVRKLNRLLQESPNGAFTYNELCGMLSDMLDSNVYIVDVSGSVLGVYYKDEKDSPTTKDPQTGEECIPAEHNRQFMDMRETAANIKGDKACEIFDGVCATSDKIHTIIPILSGGKRRGTMIMARREADFTEEELVLGEYGATVIGQEMQHRELGEKEMEERDIAAVRMAIGTLSYSEIGAVKQMLTELDGDEGLLVASRIADKSGITRSVIVNALRKLESAGVIETRSMGMKGTRIKITNLKFKEELSKVSG